VEIGHLGALWRDELTVDIDLVDVAHV